MKTIFIAFISSLTMILVLDSLWLGFMVKRFYLPRIGHLMSESPNFIAAAFFYFIYVTGVTFFVVYPNLLNANLSKVFFVGALLGVFAYGTYDLTNQATLKSWPVIVTIVDILWGLLLTGVVSVVSVMITRRLSL